MSITIWHNPRCAKSRAALALLEGHGVAPEVRLYLKDPPDVGTLMRLQALMGLRAIDMMRRGEARFKELGLSKDTEDAALIAAMAAHPILIERPVVIGNGKAVIGRPPERVLEIL